MYRDRVPYRHKIHAYIAFWKVWKLATILQFYPMSHIISTGWKELRWCGKTQDKKKIVSSMQYYMAITILCIFMKKIVFVWGWRSYTTVKFSMSGKCADLFLFFRFFSLQQFLSPSCSTFFLWFPFRMHYYCGRVKK